MTYWIFGITGIVACGIAIWQMVVYFRSRKKPILTTQDIKSIIIELEKRQKGAFYLGGFENAGKEVKNFFDEGLKFMKEGKFNEAIDHFTLALDKANGKNLVAIYNSIGLCYLYSSKFDEGIKYFEKADSLAEDFKDEEGRAKALTNIGLCYRFESNHEKALEYLNRALLINKTSERIEETIENMFEIAISYQIKGNNDKALQYLKEAIDIRQKTGDVEKIPMHLMQIGFLYMSNNDYNGAVKYFQEALEINRKVKNKYWELHSLNALGEAYKKMGNLELAFECYKKVLM